MSQTNVHLTDNHEYVCQYCHENFIPKRRYIQIYCGNSCRSKAHHKRNRNATISKTKQKANLNKIDKMSLPGIGNAAAGVALVEVVKTVLTSEENKPATKGDLKKIENKVGRFHEIKKIPRMREGYIAYFDVETKTIVLFPRMIGSR